MTKVSGHECGPEFMQTIARACIAMVLKGSDEAPMADRVFDSVQSSENFRGMMGIIIEYGDRFALPFQLRPTIDAFETGKCLSDFFLRDIHFDAHAENGCGIKHIVCADKRDFNF